MSARDQIRACARVYARMCACACVPARVCMRVCARVRARTRACVCVCPSERVYVRACVGVRACACTGACVGGRVCACMYMCGGVYVCEAILSRFKRLSPFWLYQCTTYGSYALRWLVRCLNASPMVGCGGGLWGWVVCVGVYCSAPMYKGGRGAGLWRTYAGRVHIGVPTGGLACVPMRVCLRAGVRTYAQTCARLRLRAYPRVRSGAFGGACAYVPIYILSPP